MKKTHRIASSHDFQKVFRTGIRASVGPVTCVAIPAVEGAPTRFGFVATKKVGGAVARNRAKRWLREAARAELARVKPGSQVVLLAKPSVTSSSFQQMRAAVAEALLRVGVAC